MILPDVLGRGLRVVFCGTAAGEKSAKARAYYAGPGNRFWPTLYRVGLVPREFQPGEFRSVADYGIGLTDLAKRRAGADRTLASSHFDVEGLRKKITRYAPSVLAFNGKRAAEEFLGRAVEYGLERERIGRTAIYVLPSTSGAACGSWDESYWGALRRYLRRK